MIVFRISLCLVSVFPKVIVEKLLRVILKSSKKYVQVEIHSG